MISRRGFFGMLAGLAAVPALAPLAKLFPESAGYTTYLFGDSALISVNPRPPTTYRFLYTNGPPPISKDYRIFRCGTGEMGTLYWSKENS